MFLRSNKLMKIIVKTVEKLINIMEFLFPMISGGYVVEITL